MFRRSLTGGMRLAPSEEANTEDDEAQAQAYFDTMSDVVDVYQNHPVVRSLDQILRPRIKMFHDMFMAR